MKSSVYSWRLSPERKAGLEDEARRRGESLASLLDQIADEWLTAQSANRIDDEDEQARRRRRAARVIGSISGGNARRSETARATLRRRLAARRDA